MVEPRKPKRWKKFALVCLALLAVTGGVAWWQRTALEAWYLAHRLERATDEERPAWANKLADLGTAGIHRLLGCLSKEDAGLCDAARSALVRMVQTAPAERALDLAKRLCEMRPSFSAAGQVAALELVPPLLATGPDAVGIVEPLITGGLQSPAPEQRVAAIACALRPEAHLLEAVVPLLGDESPEVRRAALLAVGPLGDGAEPLVATDALLRWLHDPDAEVRRLCELALHSRGLGERDVHLARQLTHPEPVERLQLLVQLPRDEDFALAGWVERLCNDPDSAVRAGAARLAAERRLDFADRLEQMSRSDPDRTVRRIAAHYRRLCDESPH